MRVATLIRQLQTLDPHGTLRVVLDVEANLVESDRNILDIGKVFTDHGDEINESFVYIDAIPYQTLASEERQIELLDALANAAHKHRHNAGAVNLYADMREAAESVGWTLPPIGNGGAK